MMMTTTNAIVVELHRNGSIHTQRVITVFEMDGFMKKDIEMVFNSVIS